ncbi:MAG: hypothetical protein PF569_01720 [Candidatus Woesearchaeota archaeon]|jgi:hypothetical protein|nr:hypothetical protein [Candidatus Woesearchaeota archaeon]
MDKRANYLITIYTWTDLEELENYVSKKTFLLNKSTDEELFNKLDQELFNFYEELSLIYPLQTWADCLEEAEEDFEALSEEKDFERLEELTDLIYEEEIESVLTFSLGTGY